MEAANPAAAPAPAGGDWRSQIDGLPRGVMVKQIMKALKKHLPMPDQEGLNRLHNIAVGYESKFYNTAPSQASYLWKIAMLLLYVENRNQNPHHRAAVLPPKGNNQEQSSAVPLMSQQQTRLRNTSTSEQASSVPSSGQSLTNVSETSALHDMSGLSTIPQMQLMATQSATQSGIQKIPLKIVQQPMQPLCQQPPLCVYGQQQNPQLPMHQQPSLQQAHLIQQPPVQSNNHLNPQHPDNTDVLTCHLNTENLNNLGFAFVNSHSVSPGFAICHTSAFEAGNPIVPLPSSIQLGILENNAGREHVMLTGSEVKTDIPSSWNEDSTLSDEELNSLLMVESPSPLFPVHGATLEASHFNAHSSLLYAEHMPSLFPRTETEIEQEPQDDWAAFLFSSASDTRMENNDDKENGSLACEDLNNGSRVDGATNLKKHKLDVPSSLVPEATLTHVDDYSSSQRGPQLYYSGFLVDN